jgi:two-component system, OmpR family, response regulator ChvI
MSVIGIVDDDKDTRDLLKDLLEGEGYDVLSYADGVRALSAFETRAFDLAILDIRMPEMDGIELLRRLRRTSDMPVIFMTGWVDDVNELVGLRVGADDFVHKPFSSRVLVERVRAVLRRSRSLQPVGDNEAQEDAIERGHLRMDRQRYTCSWKGTKLDLTGTEFRLLESLAARPGTVRSRDALRDLISEDQTPIDERTIDSHIKRIRRKFRAVDSEFDGIEAVYGIGYRFSHGAL